MARPFALLALFVALSLIRPGAGAAQGATPVASSAPTDLGVMALAPDDVPAGFFDDYSDWWVPAAGVVDLGVLGGAAAPPGLDRMYQSFYTDPETGLAIHCYLFEFASPEQAAAGAAVADAALRPPLREGETVGPTHSPGPAVGEEPRTTTSVTYDTRAAGGPRADVVAATFRRGSLVAGVAVERFTDPPGDGAPAAAAAAPAAPDPAQERLAARLAGTLDGRITDVLAGRAAAGVDPALAEAVLPLDRLVGPATPVFGGYMAGIDLLRCGVCGEENSLVRFGDAALGGSCARSWRGRSWTGSPNRRSSAWPPRPLPRPTTPWRCWRRCGRRPTTGRPPSRSRAAHGRRPPTPRSPAPRPRWPTTGPSMGRTRTPRSTAPGSRSCSATGW